MQGIVQRVVQDCGAAYRRTHRLCVRELRALERIETCRTEAQGHHIWACPAGDYEQLRANSCKHRSCPLCGAAETEKWLHTQRARALPCRYHQVVFTLPAELNGVWRYNRRAFTNVLFEVAWGCLRQFCADARWLGAEPGALAVFQSWGETLNVHPHLHVLLTAGGLTPDGRWVPAKAFLMPARALSVLFRGRMCAALQAELQGGRWRVPPDLSGARARSLLNRLGRKRWHVQIEPAYAHAHGVLLYVGRYFRRGPISESRIVAYDGQTLRVRYKRPEDHHTTSFTLTTLEFLERFLQHVPPTGQRLVRSYGLLHHRRRAQLELARAKILEQGLATGTIVVKGRGADAPSFHHAGPCCPRCGTRLQVVLRYYPPPRPIPKGMAA